jgi:cell fate (sporulation/competence/biofilm development) regulator YmcA (YheA/YmcA/DUF963 family)
MDNEIFNKIDEIIEYIKKSSHYQKYLLIESKMNNNEDINQLIKEIKLLQKEATHEEYLGSNENANKIDEKIKQKLTELNNIPLYNEYINTVEELNNILLNIKNQIEAYINRKTN